MHQIGCTTPMSFRTGSIGRDVRVCFILWIFNYGMESPTHIFSRSLIFLYRDYGISQISNIGFCSLGFPAQLKKRLRIDEYVRSKHENLMFIIHHYSYTAPYRVFGQTVLRRTPLLLSCIFNE